jgi:hypothetical protein
MAMRGALRLSQAYTLNKETRECDFAACTLISMHCANLALISILQSAALSAAARCCSNDLYFGVERR